MNKLRLFIPLGIAVCLVIFLFAALKPGEAAAVGPNPPERLVLQSRRLAGLCTEWCARFRPAANALELYESDRASVDALRSGGSG